MKTLTLGNLSRLLVVMFFAAFLASCSSSSTTDDTDDMQMGGNFDPDSDLDGDGDVDFADGDYDGNGIVDTADLDFNGDGISDGFEFNNAASGFDPTVDDASTVWDGRFSESQTLDLTTGNQVLIQGGGDGQDVTLSVPLFHSSDLSTFDAAGSLEATITGDGATAFCRIEISVSE